MRARIITHADTHTHAHAHTLTHANTQEWDEDEDYEEEEDATGMGAKHFVEDYSGSSDEEDEASEDDIEDGSELAKRMAAARKPADARAAGRKGKAAIGDDSDDEADLSDEGARRPKRKAKSAAGKGKKGPKASRRGGARVEIEYENEMQSVASRGAAADW